ncbi:E3 ubiquitin-protein ligase RNF146-like [Centruroides vittatus]|uniref:E3 ubiquitin-protein ligase RNF146-like n=1 Tax=Centruroides vittatus TaxID=120091 RepID=UPI00351016A4
MSSDASLVNKDREVNGESNKGNKNKNEGNPECAVCLQTSIHPVRLPCNHVFCYLCVKGVTNQSKRCAMCRQEIPTDFLDNPTLLSTNNSEPVLTFEDGHQWFYEGRNGWWQYDERTSVELETAYKRGENRCEVLIAGFLYVINFEHMVQMRRCDPSRRRRIKRDLATVPKKGVAGIRSLCQRNANVSERDASTEESDPSDKRQTDETDVQEAAADLRLAQTDESSDVGPPSDNGR